MNVNTTMFSLPPSYTGVQNLQQQLNTLQAQLSTGQVASTLSGLGSNLSSDLNVRSMLSQIGSYDTNINTVNLRLNTINSVLTNMGSIKSSALSSASGAAYGTNNINLTTAPASASTQLDQVLSGLNTDLNGHYLFGGGVTDQAPVASTGAIMNGSGNLAGFTTVAAQRLQADEGADGLGRLQLSTSGTTATLDEDGSHPFGIKLTSVGTSSASIAVSQSIPPLVNGVHTPPATSSIDFTGQPNAGDTVNIAISLPDGTSDTLNMTAVSGSPANPGEFQIGATPADTAANFQAALQSSLQTEGTTKLAVASNFAAAADFFNGEGQGVQRVAVGADGQYTDATSFETPAQTAADTVQWYKGQNDAGSARASVTTKVDSSVNVNYGVEASESGFTQLIRSLAVQSIQTYPTDTDAATQTSQAKFDAVAAGQQSRLSEASDSAPGSLVSIGVDLGLAQTTLQNLSSQHSSYSAQLQDVVSNAETADPNQVASELLQVQTQLQASFSAMSIVSQLQLANYLK